MRGVTKIDREALALFCEESADRLARISDSLDRLAASRPMDAELLHAVFRDTHSMKSAANLLDLKPVERLAHRLEDILESIRSGAELPDRELVGILSAGYGRIARLLENLHLLPLIDVSKDLAEIDHQIAARRSSGR
ncbi:MAG: Hpt domain-containing protein [Nitrospirota bacterium]|nr:Hpt domain-containing protein [Nitrospirota bacterium]